MAQESDSSMNDPERDPYPSVEDPNDDLCEWCHTMPDEAHAPTCPSYQPQFDDVLFCDRCGCSFVTACACDEGED